MFENILNKWNSTSKNSTRPHLLFLSLIIVVFLFLANETINEDAIMVDEYAHLPAGVSYWDLGRFYIYRENPPFIKCLAAFPVWLSGSKMDYSHASSKTRSEWNVGLSFIEHNSAKNLREFRRARSIIVFISIVCGITIFRWSSELFDGNAGIFCAALWFLDPNVLAFSTVVTTDIGATAMGLLASYLYWRELRCPSLKHSVLCGIMLGFALGSKFSLLILIPAWILIRLLSGRSQESSISPQIAVRKSSWKHLGLIFGISLFVLNLLYLFDGTFQNLGSFDFKSRTLTGSHTIDFNMIRLGNRFRGTAIGMIPIPLPIDYVVGLDSQKSDEELGFLKLSGGRLVRGGMWYDPFLTLSRKSPIGTLILFASTLGSILFKRERPKRDDIVVFIPPLLMFLLLCTQTGMNWINRYTLIAVPFLLIWIGRFIQFGWKYRSARLAIFACLILNIVSLFRTRPSYISYGNELVGGPIGAQHVFIGSNFDWGQDLHRLKAWSDKNLAQSPLAITYYGVIDPESIGLRVASLPIDFCRSEDQSTVQEDTIVNKPFYWAISSNTLNGLPGSILLEDGSMFLGLVKSASLKPERAIARIGYTFYVFRIVPNHQQLKDDRDIIISDLKSSIERLKYNYSYASP